MNIQDYYQFVADSDASKSKDLEFRVKVATLGVVSEIGSVLSALKKDMLQAPSNGNAEDRYLVAGELKEEIGDALWYAVMLAQCQDDPVANDIFSANLNNLAAQLTGSKRDDRRVQTELGEEKCQKFIKAQGLFSQSSTQTLDEYQKAAFITRRTEKDELRDVCVAVLQQLAAQLSRDFLPNMEMGLNHEVRPKDPVDTIGEILWHLSAIASIFDLKLSVIVEYTRKKTEFRNPNHTPGPDHNQGKPGECFPDRFEVHFVDDGNGQTNMYWVEGTSVKMKLGASLTDNNHEGDGYRFHDAVHVAFAVHLRWSPNLRSFMGLKRKSNLKIDEVEDGGRAKILEEAVILEIHLQAQAFEKYIKEAGGSIQGSPYEHGNALNYPFLRQLHRLTKGHEVEANPQQDWQNAIRDGYRCYHQLRAAKGGILKVDMDKRTLKFAEFSQTNPLDYSRPELSLG